MEMLEEPTKVIRRADQAAKELPNVGSTVDDDQLKNILSQGDSSKATSKSDGCRKRGMISVRSETSRSSPTNSSDSKMRTMIFL